MHSGRRLAACRLAILAFCAWHMLSVSLYLMPPIGVLSPLQSVTKPYVLLLSQWQQWNIFAPDPLRTSTVYRIETSDAGTWKTIRTIDAKTFAWYERAKELKILERLEDGWDKLLPSYLASLCPSLHADAAEKTIRLIGSSETLPASLPELETLSSHTLPRTERVLGTFSCPDRT